MPARFVRVSDKETGHHLTITEAEAKRRGDKVSVLKQDPLDRNGRPRPPKFKNNPAPLSGGHPAVEEATPANDTKANKEAKTS